MKKPKDILAEQVVILVQRVGVDGVSVLCGGMDYLVAGRHDPVRRADPALAEGLILR
jgi:hypothetical protein